VWTREVNGLRLTFHLAGINNQNFLMRDEETGTYWQQISGRAIAGPLKGRQLKLVPFDELTYATWKAEEPSGTVLKDDPRYASEYAKKDWDVRMKKAPVVIHFKEQGRNDRDLMVGVQAGVVSRAFPYEEVLKEKLVKDSVGAEPVLLVVAPDEQSIRVFRDRIAGVDESPDFYRLAAGKDGALMMDAPTGSEWNFQGCAISGKSQGICLQRLPAVKDYWFDWRNYNPQTSVYKAKK
jgi:hypothetical protein